MRIGILGGTFNPIHQGHLALAKAALEKLKLDQLYFVPTYQHPLEQKESSVSAEHRLEMIRMAIQGEKRFLASDCEIKRKGISYTVDTLKEFRRRFPKPHELFFITGGDWGKHLDQWKDIDTIFSLAHFVVANRPGFDVRSVPKQVEVLDFIPLDISSTQVREELKKNGNEPMIPRNVLSYIRKHRLYES